MNTTESRNGISPSGLADFALAAHLRNAGLGDVQAFRSFYDGTCALAYGMALQLVSDESDAQDVVLDAYALMWRFASAYRPEVCSDIGMGDHLSSALKPLPSGTERLKLGWPSTCSPLVDYQAAGSCIFETDRDRRTSY